MTDPLADFLLARIAEDEAVAGAAEAGPWTADGGEVWAGHPSSAVVDYARGGGGTADHIARWDPARVLAECDAKRWIVDAYLDERSRRDVYQRDDAMATEDEKQRTSRRSSAARTRGLEIAVQALALPYADHSDWREEWRP